MPMARTALAAACLLLPTGAGAVPSRPNIVFILSECVAPEDPFVAVPLRIYKFVALHPTHTRLLT